MKGKISVVILFGGMSSEHEISRLSAASIIEHIDGEKYHTETVGLTKSGRWLLTGASSEEIKDGSWESRTDNRRAFITPDRSIGGLFVENSSGAYEVIKADVVFPVLHGRNGEDGTIQGLLEISGLPFVGSSTASSAASMDKAITKAIVEQVSAAEQAKCYVMSRNDYLEDAGKHVEALLDFFNGEMPLFVKPANAGSSVGISKVKSASDIDEALRTAFAEDDKAVIEETITGREIEVAVLGNDHPKASSIGEIFSAHEFYDYDSKYENTGSKTAVVADLSEEKELEIRDTAVRIYKAMGCEGLSRVDFFLEDSGRVVFNEINTLPGFTHISMYPKLWEASGIEYSELIDELIRLALEERIR